jgi:hypothetical protein
MFFHDTIEFITLYSHFTHIKKGLGSRNNVQEKEFQYNHMYIHHTVHLLDPRSNKIMKTVYLCYSYGILVFVCAVLACQHEHELAISLRSKFILEIYSTNGVVHPHPPIICH